MGENLEITSKGYLSLFLFYYFHNKRELYFYVYQYESDVMRQQLMDQKFLEITDFFDLLEYATIRKTEIIRKNPYLLEFAMRCFYSEKEEVSDGMKEINSKTVDQAFAVYCRNIDFSKFRDDIDPKKIYRMLIWMADGYLHELQMKRQPLVLENLETVFREWTDFFRKISYTHPSTP